MPNGFMRVRATLDSCLYSGVSTCMPAAGSTLGGSTRAKASSARNASSASATRRPSATPLVRAAASLTPFNEAP
jgi:hypothetical protein